MVDFNTYRKMHSSAAVFKHKAKSSDILPLDAMEKDEPPDDQFLLLLPANVWGFSLQDKKWSPYTLNILDHNKRITLIL